MNPSEANRVWFFSSHWQLRYFYDETHDQIVYENGVATDRDPSVSREDLMAAAGRGCREKYENEFVVVKWLIKGIKQPKRTSHGKSELCTYKSD